MVTDKTPWLLDAHCDGLMARAFFGDEIDLSHPEVHLNNQAVVEAYASGLGGRTEGWEYQVTLGRLERGNVGCLFLNVGDIDLMESSLLVDRLEAMAAEVSGPLAVCRSAREVRETVGSGRLAVVMSIESQFMFMGRADLLRNWHRLGVRVASLTHGEGTEKLSGYARMILPFNRLYAIGDPASHALQGTESLAVPMGAAEREALYKKEKGLTGPGREMLGAMEEMGMVCDLSHSNDATFREALELSAGKVCTTHSNCAAISPHTRNLTDSMMRSLAERGGVMGLCFFGGFIDEREPSLGRFVEHVLHALEVVGPDHVGIGSDYDGVPFDAFMAVPNPEHTGELWRALEDAGLDGPTMRKIAHENFLRLLD